MEARSLEFEQPVIQESEGIKVVFSDFPEEGEMEIGEREVTPAIQILSLQERRQSKAMAKGRKRKL